MSETVLLSQFRSTIARWWHKIGYIFTDKYQIAVEGE